MVRWLLNVMVFAMLLAFLAIFAVKLQCVMTLRLCVVWPGYGTVSVHDAVSPVSKPSLKTWVSTIR